MTESQSALPGTGDGVACVLDLLNALMRSLEERLAPPPPPPSLLARIRRLVTGKTVVDQCRRAVCAMMRARLGQVAAGLAAAVAADLEAANLGAADLGAADCVDELSDGEAGAAPCEAELDAPVHDAGCGSDGTVSAGAGDSPAPHIGPTVRAWTHLQMLKACVSHDALGCRQAAHPPALPSVLPERGFTPASTSPAPRTPLVALCDWKDALPRRARWQEARGPDHPRRGALRDGGNRITHARPFRCVFELNRQTATGLCTPARRRAGG